MIMRTPLAQSLRDGEIFVGHNIINAGRHQVRTHVCKVGITPVVVLQVIAVGL
ncbi:hypothetical protein SDC9_168071 [bioreactor metagenome]|uniref:Uncharacterized protein n=1 Tax=bioreactor metagenome TaxID=1076179 RepID=A0A645G427_9ZZZZ